MIWQLKEILKFSESPYTKIISDGVLKLQEDGILTQLRNKWWNQKYVPEEPCVSIEFKDTLMSTNAIIKHHKLEIRSLFSILFHSGK